MAKMQIQIGFQTTEMGPNGFQINLECKKVVF